MVIYSTTNDKPVLGEIVKMGLCQNLTKGHSMSRGELKNSSYCVAVEYPSQATSTNPHFFGSHPPLLTFFGEWCIIISATILYWHLDGVIILNNLLKFIVMLLRRIEKILHSGK